MTEQQRATVEYLVDRASRVPKTEQAKRNLLAVLDALQLSDDEYAQTVKAITQAFRF